jgi:hypothetical protein
VMALPGRLLDLRTLAAQTADGDLRARLPEAWWAAVPGARRAAGELAVFIDGRRYTPVVGMPPEENRNSIAYYYAPGAHSIFIRCGDASCEELLAAREDPLLRAMVFLNRLRHSLGMALWLGAAALAALWLAMASGPRWAAVEGFRAPWLPALGLTLAAWACLLAGAYETEWSGWALAASCVVLGGPALSCVGGEAWRSWSGGAAAVEPRSAPRLPISSWLLATIGIVTFVGRVVTLMYVQSPTLDEVIHIPAGYGYWAARDFWLNPEHPALVKLVSGLGFTFLHGPVSWRPTMDFTDPVVMCRSFFLPDVMTRSLCARIPMLLFSVLLLVGLYRLLRHLMDDTTAALSIWAVASSPVLVAHSVFVHTDVAASLAFLAIFGVAALRPAARFDSRAAVLGAVAALGMLMKFSVAVAVLGALVALPSWAPKGRRLRDLSVFSASLLLCFLLFSWACYLGCSAPTEGPHTGAPGRWLRTSIPSYYEDGWERVRGHNAQGHANVFLRQGGLQGHLLYFPVAIALKTPLPVLITMLVGLVTILRRPPPWLPVWLAIAGIYSAFLLGSNINIGVRHALPLLVLLAMPLAAGIQFFLDGAAHRAAGALLMAWLLMASFRCAGSELAYFNELVGNGHGWEYLGDSNVDWGQSVAALGRFAEHHDLEPLYYDLPTALPPSWFGLQGRTLEAGVDGRRLRPGWYAVSAARLASSEGGWLDYFRSASPVETFDGAVYLYRVPAGAAM